MRLVFCFLCDFSYEHVRANNLLVRSALAQLVEHALRKRMVVGSSRPPLVINPSPRAVYTLCDRSVLRCPLPCVYIIHHPEQ